MAGLKRLSSLMTFSFSCRLFSYTPSVSAKSKKVKVLSKASSMLNSKVSGTQKNKRTQWYDTPLGIGATGTFSVTKKGPSQGSQRRAHQLSVVLSQYVISLINSGELDPRIPDLGVEVVKVKLVPSLGALHIYWLATGTKKDEEIQTILQESSYKLRTMLTGLHVMNSLPPVVFIKDLSQAKLNQLQELLERADMGPDHEPTDLGADLKADIILSRAPDVLSRSQLQDQMETINKNLSSRDLDMTDSVQTVPSPKKDPMSDLDLGLNFKSDLYNLDHASLIQKVIQTKRRKGTRALEVTEASQNETHKVMSQLTKKDIQKFLALRKVKEKKSKSQSLLDSGLYRSETSDYDDDHEGYIQDDDIDMEEMDEDEVYKM